MKKVKFDNIYNSLNTGDIVLFSGKGPISFIVKFATQSIWSHVGMIVRIPGYDFPCIWESTTINQVPDVVTNKKFKGVQLTNFYDRVYNYPKGGIIAIRKLIDADYGEETANKLIQFIQKNHKKPYERKILHLFKAAYDGVFGLNDNDDFSSIFCSELIAETYKCMGLLSNDILSSEYTPKDFSSKRNLTLLNGAKLEEEIQVVKS